jgi:hypothetical protein
MIIEDSRIEEKQCPGTTEALTIAAATTTGAEVLLTASTSFAVTSTSADAPRQFPFKNPAYEHKNIVNGRRKPWRTLKQILSQVKYRFTVPGTRYCTQYQVPGTDFFTGNWQKTLTIIYNKSIIGILDGLPPFDCLACEFSIFLPLRTIQ